MKTLEDILFYNFSYEERLILLIFLEMINKEYGNITCTCDKIIGEKISISYMWTRRRRTLSL